MPIQLRSRTARTGLVLIFLCFPGPDLPGAEFFRGDTTVDGYLDISDPVRLLSHLFLGTSLLCQDAADADDSGFLDITDPIYLLGHQFLGGLPPAPPFPGCGPDPSHDALACDSFPPCSLSDVARIGPGGGTLLLEDDRGRRVSLTFEPGILAEPTDVSGAVSRQTTTLLDPASPTLLWTIELAVDAGRLDSAAEAGNLTVDVPLSLVEEDAPPGAAAIEDLTAVVYAAGRRYFWVLPLEDPGDTAPPTGRLATVPATIFRRAREWALVGRTSVIQGIAITILEVLPGGRVLLDQGGLELEGTLEFAPGGQRATIGTQLRNTLVTFDVTVPAVEVRLELVIGLARALYSRMAAVHDSHVGNGELFHVALPARVLETPAEFLPDGDLPVPEHAPIVLVHGWDFLEPFHGMLELDATELVVRPPVIPGNEAAYRTALLEHWGPMLQYLDRPGADGVYLYAFNPLRSLDENAHQLRTKLEQAFAWSTRENPLTLLGHSSGGLLAATAIHDEFAAGGALARGLRCITLGSPLRGTPLASRGFDGHRREGGLAAVLEAARYLWRDLDLDARRLLPVELLGSLEAAATFLRTDAPGARDLDLDARWGEIGDGLLDPVILPVATEWSGAVDSPTIGLLTRLLADFRDPLDREPYARSDGFVPLSSALRRRGPSAEFWFRVESSSPGTGHEVFVAGHDHLSFHQADDVFRRLGLGAHRLGTTIGLETVYIPAGRFSMGAPPTEGGRSPDETLHEVNLTRGFYLGATEVTQEAYETVMGANPSFFSDDPVSSQQPVERVTWSDAREFCCRLTRLERAAGTIRPHERFRLPTEAEWEYACRAGSDGSFFFGEAALCPVDACSPCPDADSAMWWCANSGRRPHPVATRVASPWNLYDTHGNVSEWCRDWYGAYPEFEVTDPGGPDGGVLRLLRGGNWFSEELQACRSADRGKALPTDRGSNFGFRVVLAVEALDAPPLDCDN